MCNLSDRYAPLLAPRRSRVRIDTLQGKAEYIIYKNNLYFYSAQDGIYCYAPQGENPFAGGSGDATVRIYESSDVYDFIEMGNKILCVDKTNNLDYLYDTIDDNKLENSGGSDVTLMAARGNFKNDCKLQRKRPKYRPRYGI